MIHPYFPLGNHIHCINYRISQSSLLFFPNLHAQVFQQNTFKYLHNPTVKIIICPCIGQPILNDHQNWITNNVEVKHILMKSKLPIFNLFFMILQKRNAKSQISKETLEQRYTITVFLFFENLSIN